MFLKHRARREHGGFSDEIQENFGQENKITAQIIDSCIKVHKALGPGLLESAYESCLVHELKKRNLKLETQKPIPIVYDGLSLDSAFRADMIVEGVVLLELKAVENLQYMKPRYTRT